MLATVGIQPSIFKHVPRKAIKSCRVAFVAALSCAALVFQVGVQIVSHSLTYKAINIQAAAKWYECFLDVLHVLWCYVAKAQTLTVSLRENHVWCKASLAKSFSFDHLAKN